MLDLNNNKAEDSDEDIYELNTGGLDGEHLTNKGLIRFVITGSPSEKCQHNKNEDNKNQEQRFRKVNKATLKQCLLTNVLTNNQSVDTLHVTAEKSHCTGSRCLGSIVKPSSDAIQDLAPGELRRKADVLCHAKDFLKQYYDNRNGKSSHEMESRLVQISEQIALTGTYEMTEKELVFGARTAWRNAARCIGRIQWKKLQVFDFRHCRTPGDMFECILQHLKFSTNDGNIRSAISIFPHKTENGNEFRIWNSQLIRYAGYKQADGSVIGDPASVEFTEIALEMGWHAAGTQFEVLPLILQASGTQPELFEIPKEYVLEVNITHPNYPQIGELGLKWYAVPCVADIAFDCGGLQYTAAPFNGWYMATELSARNFTDSNRYNLLKPIGKRLGLDTSSNTSLWKDKVALELTTAVLHSFKEVGATIVDHHTASESFMKHMKDEERLRGGCPSDWVWIVPPISGSITPVFHQEMLNYKLYPSYEYQELPWKYLNFQNKSPASPTKRRFKDLVLAVKFSNSLFANVLARRSKVTILYATETGKSQEFAARLKELFMYAFDAKCLCMDEYNILDLENEQCLLLVASTFGNGEAPDNGKGFVVGLREIVHDKFRNDQKTIIRRYSSSYTGLDDLLINVPGLSRKILPNLRYSVFALGSRAYPHFCEFGHTLNRIFGQLGSEQIYPIGEGDELCAQEESFKEWARTCFETYCKYFAIKGYQLPKSIMLANSGWKEGGMRLTVLNGNDKQPTVTEGLKKLHKRDVYSCPLISVENLQCQLSDRVTNLVRLSTAEHGNKLKYEPGDHLFIHPRNNIEYVQELLQMVRCYGTKSTDLINVETLGENGEWETANVVPMPTTLNRIFECYLDISQPPSTSLLKNLSDKAIDYQEQIELMGLATNADLYEDWKVQENPSVLEVLKKFPSVDVDVLLLINQLPLLKPRPYSISSSLRLHNNEVHATVALVEYTVKSGATHRGVCSSYLHRLNTHDAVHCFIKSVPSFHLPDKKEAQVIMIGPGTGIAPFRSFWQELMFERSSSDISEKRNRHTILYFGCRHPDLDDIYKDELQKALQCGAISKLYKAYSRMESKPKVYVQDVLTENFVEVCNMLLNPLTHLYICGDVTMAHGVAETLEATLIHYQACSQREAELLFCNMKKEGRYHEDIFGVTLKIKEVKKRARTTIKRLQSADKNDTKLNI